MTSGGGEYNCNAQNEKYSRRFGQPAINGSAASEIEELSVSLRLVNDPTQAFNYTTGTNGNVRSVTSTNKTNNSSSVCKIYVDAACTLSFSYSVSSEEKYDKMTIKHCGANGNVKNTLVNGASGSQSRSKTVTMSAGDYIEISYSKDSSDSAGSDQASVTDITVTK